MNEATMTRGQRLLLSAIFVVVVLSRVWGAAASVWEWDEALFACGVLEYDVASHHPHPPGYPLFIGAAKLLHAAGLPPFRSLQFLNIVAGSSLFLLAFLLLRVRGESFEVALTFALLLVGLPHVWFYSETAFSDVTTLAVAMSGMLLLMGRAPWTVMAGFGVAGATVALRPQAVLLLLFPLAAAVWSNRRTPRRIAVGALLAAAVVVLAYGAAVLATTDGSYFQSLRVQSQYVAKVDSFRNPLRPRNRDLFEAFVLVPFIRSKAGLVLLASMIVGAVVAFTARWRRSAGVIAASFVPVLIASLLLLDVGAGVRYAVSYAPFFAYLGAAGLCTIFRRLAPIAAAVIALTFSAWALPSIRIARDSLAPTRAAAEWARDHGDARTRYFVARGMTAFTDEVLAGRVSEAAERPPLAIGEGEAFFISDRCERNARCFLREEAQFPSLARNRYRAASVSRVDRATQFGDGWYAVESDGARAWRWASRKALLRFGVKDKPQDLTLKLTPAQQLAGATLDVSINGTAQEKRTVGAEPFTLDYKLAANRENVLALSFDRAATPHDADPNTSDRRELTAYITDIWWNTIE